jgi:hypothetical protein
VNPSPRACHPHRGRRPIGYSQLAHFRTIGTTSWAELFSLLADDSPALQWAVKLAGPAHKVAQHGMGWQPERALEVPGDPGSRPGNEAGASQGKEARSRYGGSFLSEIQESMVSSWSCCEFLKGAWESPECVRCIARDPNLSRLWQHAHFAKRFTKGTGEQSEP